MKSIIATVLLAFASSLHSQELELGLPFWAGQSWKNLSSQSGLRMSKRLNPYVWRGDFDGDGRADLAVLVERVVSKKQGIAILLQGKRPLLIGAGIDFGNGGDDFSWVDFWHVEDRGTKHGNYHQRKPVTLKADGLMVAKESSASALIYMKNGKLQWHQYGD
jgi:hypothetical protein